jgi:hypothetical protein
MSRAAVAVALPTTSATTTHAPMVIFMLALP